MTQDEIIEMARQAGFLSGNMHNQMNTSFITAIGKTFEVELNTFAKLVAKKEREACAKLVESFQRDHIYTADMAGLVGAVKHKLADAIRAKGNV